MQAARKQYTPPGVATVFDYLQEADANPSEWYMLVYLNGLSAHKGGNPFRTTMTAMRSGEHGKGLHVAPLKMARNTANDAIEGLEAKGLIRVDRTKESVTVHLDIHIL